MTKKTRTLLFFACFFLFILITPSVIFYSLGYRIDWNSKKITQTGAFFLDISPTQAEIYIDGKLKDKTEFFWTSVFIENLLPKLYTVRVEKNGYHPWEKTLAVKAKEATEVKNITLFPENVKLELLNKNVEDFWFSPNEKKIIIKESSNGSWSLKLYETDKELKSHLIDETAISTKGADLLSLEFSKNSEEVYLKLWLPTIIADYKIELNKTPISLVSITVPSFPVEDALAHEEADNNIYYLDQLGNLFKADASFNQKTKLTKTPFPVKAETEYSLKIFKDYIFLKENQTLYLFSSETGSFEKFFEGIKDLASSPDQKKLAYFSANEIWIMYLEEDLTRPVKNKEEKVLLSRLSEKTGYLFWVNSNYLIFNCADKIKITEIDERDKINVIQIAEFKSPEIFWNELDKKVYIESEGRLYRSERLLK